LSHGPAGVAPHGADRKQDLYFMALARAVREGADCLRAQVGAVIVLNGRVISTGFNCTPDKIPNCSEGGCVRCSNPERFPPGKGYDLCLCVHAEQNALLTAARFGIGVAGATIYSTMRPCFGCTKELVQAGIVEIVYLDDWRHSSREVRRIYEGVPFPIHIRRLTIPGADYDSLLVADNGADELGHAIFESSQISLFETE
jgi:dCMP deaminase